MTFSKDFLDNILDRISLYDVISRHVKLQKRGRNFIGLCPFHNEKTPSFTVNEDKNFYHCFGCGAHGNAINFEMHINNYSFFEVIKNFADQLGLKLPNISEEDQKREKEKAEYYDIMEKACNFYQQKLSSKSEALEYLKNKRHLSDDIIKRFKLGYAPTGNAILAFFKKNNVDIDKLIKLGLLQKSEKYGLHDSFFDRIMFPIQDSRGRVIAFGGRVLSDKLPKYINSPETPLFKKNHVLYGLAQARETTFIDKRIIAVEGYVDVISMVSAGITSVVAPLGTAIGENHFNILWKLNDKPILCFDGDGAGQKAAIRASFLALPLLKAGKSLQIAILPEDKDPDDLINSSGVDALNNVLNSAESLIDIIWKTLLSKENIDTPEEKAKFETEIKKCCETIRDNNVKKFYLQELNNRMWQLFNKTKNNTYIKFKEKGNNKNMFSNMRIEKNSVRLIANNTPDSILNLLANIICFPKILLPYIEKKYLFLVQDAKTNDFISHIFLIISTTSDIIDTNSLIDNLIRNGFSNILNKMSSKIELYRTVKEENAQKELVLFIKKQERNILKEEIQKERDINKIEILRKDKNRIDNEILKIINSNND